MSVQSLEVYICNICNICNKIYKSRQSSSIKNQRFFIYE